MAQLNGEEDASTGQILAVNLKTKQRMVLLDKLNKPTGLAWFDGFLWVMEQRRLVRSPWADPTAKPGPIEVLVDQLPFNGRSEGTLTVTPTSHLLYETTGSIEGGSVVDGSGVLWEFDPSTKTSSKFAVGLKNSYAHTFLPDGRLVTVDIGDNVDAAPVDELNLLPSESTDNKPPQFGWPDCPGDTTCAGVIAPLTTFSPHSTPSGVAANKQYAYVTLFVTGQLQRVALGGQATNAEQTTIASELQGPHTVMLRQNGQLWISEHLANRIISITPPD